MNKDDISGGFKLLLSVVFGISFTFVERQKRMIIDGEDFYLDLLFYHRILKRLVAVELKLCKFQARDKGQMELYLKWLNRHERQDGENMHKDGAGTKAYPATAYTWYLIARRGGYAGEDIARMLGMLEGSLTPAQARKAQKDADAWIESYIKRRPEKNKRRADKTAGRAMRPGRSG